MGGSRSRRRVVRPTTTGQCQSPDGASRTSSGSGCRKQPPCGVPGQLARQSTPGLMATPPGPGGRRRPPFASAGIRPFRPGWSSASPPSAASSGAVSSIAHCRAPRCVSRRRPCRLLLLFERGSSRPVDGGDDRTFAQMDPAMSTYTFRRTLTVSATPEGGRGDGRAYGGSPRGREPPHHPAGWTPALGGQRGACSAPGGRDPRTWTPPAPPSFIPGPRRSRSAGLASGGCWAPATRPSIPSRRWRRRADRAGLDDRRRPGRRPDARIDRWRAPREQWPWRADPRQVLGRPPRPAASGRRRPPLRSPDFMGIRLEKAAAGCRTLDDAGPPGEHAEFLRGLAICCGCRVVLVVVGRPGRSHRAAV